MTSLLDLFQQQPMTSPTCQSDKSEWAILDHVLSRYVTLNLGLKFPATANKSNNERRPANGACKESQTNNGQ